MILISHRGNINGRIVDYENNPEYINNTIRLGYNVELDVWLHQGNWYLGHDEPKYKIDINWLSDRRDKLWVHCKNIESLEFLNNFNYDLNFFWHQNDTLTLTSKKFIWVYPGKQPIKNSIAVLPELFNDDVSFSLGVCSDIIQQYEILKK